MSNNQWQGGPMGPMGNQGGYPQQNPGGYPQPNPTGHPQQGYPGSAPYGQAPQQYPAQGYGGLGYGGPYDGQGPGMPGHGGPQPPGKNSKALLIALIAVIVVALGVGVTYLIMRNQGSSATPTTTTSAPAPEKSKESTPSPEPKQPSKMPESEKPEPKKPEKTPSKETDEPTFDPGQGSNAPNFPSSFGDYTSITDPSNVLGTYTSTNGDVFITMFTSSPTLAQYYESQFTDAKKDGDIACGKLNLDGSEDSWNCVRAVHGGTLVTSSINAKSVDEVLATTKEFNAAWQ